MNTSSPHPAVVAIRRFIEPWRREIAEVLERPYKLVFPDDRSGDNDPEDIIINIRPKNDKAAPLELLAYADQVDRVAVAIDCWSHLASLIGCEHSIGKRGIDFYVGSAGEFVSLEVAEQVIQAAARGDIVVKAAIIGRRIGGTSLTVLLGDGSFVGRGILGTAGASLLSLVGLAEVRTYRYEPWSG